MTEHLIDTSGTGWGIDSDTAQMNIAAMNRHRVELGLQPISATTTMSGTPIPADVAAGDHAYLVNLAEPGAALAISWAGMDHDGVLGHLPHGQTLHLIEARGVISWSARTVAEVADFHDHIEWLSKALPAAGLAYAAPVRCDAHTTNPTWNSRSLRRIHDALAAGDAVWTTVLDAQAALKLAKQAGLPGISEVHGVLICVDFPSEDGIDAPTPGWAGLPDPADMLKQVVDTGWRREGPPVQIFTDEGGIPMRGGGKTNMVAKLIADIQREGRDDAIYITGDPHGHRFEMFAWTDRAGTLDSGDFTNLRNDLRRRNDQDLPDIARVYALDADAGLVEVRGYDVEYDSASSVDSAPRFRLTITLPDGGRVTGTYRTKGRK